MALLIHRGVAHIRVRFVAPWQQDRCANGDGPAPEGAQELASNLHALDPLVVGRHIDGGDDLGQVEFDDIARLGVEADC